MKNEKKLNNKGFSLVELIIVIAIMAVLIAVLAPQYMRYVERGRAASDRDNVQAIVSALQVHAVDTEATNAITAGNIQLTRGATATTTNASFNEALTNAGLPTTMPALTNQSTFSSVDIVVTVTDGNVQVTTTENT